MGLSATFSQPIDLAKVTVKGATPGTVIEIRAAQHPNPYLDDARVVAGPTTVSGESTDIPLSTTTQSTHIIIWITQMGDTGTGQFQSQIADLEFFTAYQS